MLNKIIPKNSHDILSFINNENESLLLEFPSIVREYFLKKSNVILKNILDSICNF